MELSELRSLFLQLSGRYDLVDPDDFTQPAGCDVYLVEGSRFLDRKMTTANDMDSIFCKIKVDSYFLSFAEARVIKEVWFYDTSERIKLVEYPRDKIRLLFGDILTGVTKAAPYTYGTVRGKKVSGASPADFLTEIKLSTTDMNGIVYNPSDRVGTIEVVGKFYSPNLIDEEENYWSVHHGMLLVWAAMYNLEISYRNTEGSKDWLRAISDAVASIEMDHVEEDSWNLRQLGGREND